MNGIAGFCNLNENNNHDKMMEIISDMGNAIKHRSGNSAVSIARERYAFCQVGGKVLSRAYGGNKYSIIMDGEITNREIFALSDKMCDAEVVLNAYLIYGTDFAEKLDGSFAIAIWDGKLRQMVLCRDRLGLRPLFYAVINNELIFGSEIKAMLRHPKISADVDKSGLAEIFGIGPARARGYAIYKDITDMIPGTLCVFNEYGLKKHTYWELKSTHHTDGYTATIEKTAGLVMDSIEKSVDSKCCSLLSGGLDSSLITAIAANKFIEDSDMLTTYSFDFKENDNYFQSNDYQSSQDKPFAEKVSRLCNTEHHFLECTPEDLADGLYASVRCKDLPGMADIDSSLYYFLGEISKDYKYALSGESADEIFGGYPWFRNPVAFNTATFPWSHAIDVRKSVIAHDVQSELKIDDHIDMRYFDALAEVPKLHGEKSEDARRREIAYLNIIYFMQNLIERTERISMAHGLTVRCPYADYKILEYVFNIPWKFKYRGEVTKSLLREIGKGYLPNDLLYRKKSPFPKTYHPHYEKIIAERLNEVVNDSSSPINGLINKDIVLMLIEEPSAYGKPWFGQLMAKPQLLAYLLQINYWMKEYKINLC